MARAARPGAGNVERIAHGLQHDLMLAHAEIVVGAPDRDLLGAAVAMVAGEGKIAGLALEIGEHTIAAFGLQLV